MSDSACACLTQEYPSAAQEIQGNGKSNRTSDSATGGGKGGTTIVCVVTGFKEFISTALL